MPILKGGMGGSEVVALQRALKGAGFLEGAIDGIFGQNTWLAVKAFQKANGFDPNGIAGEEVQSALASAPKKLEKCDEEALEIIRQGPEVWNKWCKGRSIDLEGAMLSGLQLPGINLEGVNLKGAFLKRSYLRGANLEGAILTGANLGGADLTDADVSNTDLRQASLNQAFLINADLSGADMREADCFQVNLRMANLSAADLTKAQMMGANLIEATAPSCNMSEVFCLTATMSNASFIGANFERAALNSTRLDEVDFSGCNLREVDFSHASMIGTNLSGADITGSRIFGVSTWNVEMAGITQSRLIATPSGEPELTVDDIEIAQSIHVLLDYKKLQSVMNNITERGVLLLGRFKDGGLEILHAIADRLREHEQKYLPIIFDFERPKDRDLIETIVTLAGLSRFIIADLSGPLVPKELAAIVPNIHTPCVQIIQSGRKAHRPSAKLKKSKWLVQTAVEYNDTEELLGKLNASVIAPAEQLRTERLSDLKRMFIEAPNAS